ncbi:MAG: PEP-CTERM sorting domain-containing protein [Verrucomicrobia bacterium]|nr:PEP-CTERM sorting domain-containing protein [Verrucomicrobiota bacterium]MCH8511922.1 PEP-CTERM sorting domain-containing protein [Kiritimatiellia bacterium]
MKTTPQNVHFPKTILVLCAMCAMAFAPLASATLIGYESFDGVSNGLLAGQATQSTIGFAGTETWTGPSGNASAQQARSFSASTSGLTFPGLVTSGGNAEAYRTTTFNDNTTTPHRAELSSSTPTTNTPDEVFFSALINADGYTAREGDTSLHGVELRFLHESGGRSLGFGFGGASGGDETAAKTLFVRGFDGNPSTSVRLESDLVLASGTNLVVLSIARPGGSGDNTYSLWLNPVPGAPQGTPDWQGTLNWGIVVDGGSQGFYGFDMTQSFNGIQSVLVDELRFGTSYDAVSPIPEPGTLVLFGVLLGTLAVFRRRPR